MDPGSSSPRDQQPSTSYASYDTPPSTGDRGTILDVDDLIVLKSSFNGELQIFMCLENMAYAYFNLLTAALWVFNI